MRGTRVAVLVAVIAGSVFVGHGSAGAVVRSGPRYMYAGHGYGTYIAGGGVKVGKTANVVMWCRTKPGIHHSNSVGSVQVPGVLQVGEVVSQVDGTSLAKGAGKKAVGSVNLQNLSLIGGLVTVDQLKAISTTVHTASGFALSDAGAVFSNISVAGQPLPLPTQIPDPNTRVDLPGVGYVVLNEQTRISSPTRAVLAINLLHLHVTLDNPVLGIKKGLNVVVGHASSGLVQVGGPLGGTAYTSSLNGAGLLSAGPAGALYLPCAGTDGKTRSNNVGSLGVPGVLSIATGSNVGKGAVGPQQVVGDIQSTAQGVRLLAGMITADAVNAHVHAVRKNGTRTFSDLSTGFVNLVVNGQAVGGDAPPNTKMEIPGVGTLWLHHVVHTKHGLRVTMIELKVLQAGNGLPAGANLRVASAQLSIY